MCQRRDFKCHVTPSTMGHYVSNGLSDYGNLSVLCSLEARWHLPRTHSHLLRDTQKTNTTCQITRKEARVGPYLNTLICVVNTLAIWNTCLSRSIMLQHAFWKVEPVSVYVWTWDGIIKIHLTFIKEYLWKNSNLASLALSSSNKESGFKWIVHQLFFHLLPAPAIQRLVFKPLISMQTGFQWFELECLVGSTTDHF